MRWIRFTVLVIIYLALAWKNPFKQNNLIGNLEPFPDTLYYSTPAWNLVHGDGFKMAAFGIEIKPIVPPLYGLYLSPFFKIFNDVRSYYYGNIILGLLTIWLFLKLTDEYLGKEKWWLAGGLGFILVTNFYFYSLPTLLMAENILLPLTIGAILIGLQKIDTKNIYLSIIVGIFLSITKVSSLPVIFVLGLMTIVKIIKSGWFTGIGKGTMVFFALVTGIGLMMTTWLVIIPNTKLLNSVGEVFAGRFAERNIPIFLKEFVGIDGKYLWYNNPQIETIVGWLSLMGLVVALFIKRLRSKSLWLVLLIISVVIFHASMDYAEGRYISTVIPIYLIFSGVIFEAIRNGKISVVLMIVLIGLYLGLKTNVNGFYERKATTLKRQFLNNQLEQNEVPWNYASVENFNKYFSEYNEKNYLATLLPPFYISFFSNGNFKYLPFSEYQEFSGENKGYIEAVYKNDKNLFGTYERLINEGNKVFVSNYYMVNYHGRMDGVFKAIESRFKLNAVADGCMGLCKIYELELRK